jgi:hypothetical protein
LSPESSALIELYNIQGQLIQSERIRQGLQMIPATLPTGTIIIKMITANETATQKVLIQ